MKITLIEWIIVLYICFPSGAWNRGIVVNIDN